MRTQMHGEVDASAVRLVRWPSDADGRDEAARAGVPCLLVVDRGSPIPAVLDHEDWILDTADERDVAARLHNLATRGWVRGRDDRSAPRGSRDLGRS